MNEDYSDVAYGYTEYGIAYIKDGEAYIAFYHYDGTFMNRYLLSDGNQRASNPAVAFEGTNNYFVVAWQHDYGSTGDMDIRIRSISPFTGPVEAVDVVVAETTNNETKPDLDCNHNDTSCLVVFNTDEGDDFIQGRFMEVKVTGMAEPSHEPFRVSNGDEAYDPYVAWGDSAGTYFVVYRWPGNASYASSGICTHLLDSYQSAASNQYLHDGTFLIGDASHDKYPTDVAFDPLTEKYLVLFTYDFSGDGSDYDVRMAVWDGIAQSEYGPTGGQRIADLGSDIDEMQGSISFLTNAWSAQFDPGLDKVAVAYNRSDSSMTDYPDGVVTVVITGNGSTSFPSYDVPGELDHTLVKAPPISFGSFNTRSAVAGRDGTGDYIVTWTDFINGITAHYDVNGMIFMYNAAPFFNSTAVTSASVGEAYTYNVTATDLNMPAGDALTITADSKPGWLTLSDSGDGTASLSGTPSLINVGDHSVTLRVTDLDGVSGTQSFTVTVVEEPNFSVYLPLILK